MYIRHAVYSLYIIYNCISNNYTLDCTAAFSYALRDWSLITGRGGLQNGRGGHVKFYPYKKGGGRKKFKTC